MASPQHEAPLYARLEEICKFKTAQHLLEIFKSPTFFFFFLHLFIYFGQKPNTIHENLQHFFSGQVKHVLQRVKRLY